MKSAAYTVLLLLVVATCLIAQEDIIEEQEKNLSPKSISELPALNEWEKQLQIGPDEKSAVILYSSGYKKDSWTDSSFSAVKRLKILNEEGKRFATFEVKIRAYEELTEVQGKTILPDGREQQLDPSQYQLEASYKDLWSPELIYTFTAPAAEPGAIIEYSYTIETQLGDALRFNIWNIQDIIHSYTSSYTLDTPESFMPYSWDMENTLTTANPAVYEEGDRRYTVFDFGEMLSIDFEEYMPPLSFVQGRLVVDYQWNRSLTSVPRNYWYQIGRSQAKRVESFIKDEGELEELVIELVGEQTNVQEKVDTIIRWIHNNITNLSYLPTDALIEDEELIHEENTTAIEVLESGYGSPYEISLLTIGMLRAAGIESYLALTVNRETGLYRMNFLDHHQLNEALIAIAIKEGQMALIHPTARFSQTTGIPWYIQGGQAVICRARRSRLIRIPVEYASENSAKYIIEVNQQRSGEAEGKLTAEFQGQAVLVINRLLLDFSSEERPDYIARQLNISDFRVKITSISITYVEGQTTGFEIRFTLPDFQEQMAGKIHFQPIVFRGLLELPEVLSPTVRMHPLYLPFAFQSTTEFIITNLATKELKLPNQFEHQGPSGTIRSFWKVSDNVIEWKWQLSLQKLFYKQVESNQFQDFLQRVKSAKSFYNRGF